MENLVSWLVTSTVGALCGLGHWESQPLFVHSGHGREELRNGEWRINRTGCWHDNSQFFVVFCGGGERGCFREEFRPWWDAPQWQTCLKENKIKQTLENPSLFPWPPFTRQTRILRFKLALSCGFLNWAAGSWLLPHRPMFLTSFDFEKNKGVFLLALIAALLNFQFFPKANTVMCLYPSRLFDLCHSCLVWGASASLS